MARNPEGIGRLIICPVRIHCGQVSTGKYTRSSARLAVDSVGSSAEKRDRVRSTRGSRVIRPWHREIRVEAIATMWPTRSQTPEDASCLVRVLLYETLFFFESRCREFSPSWDRTAKKIERRKSGLPGYRCPVNRGSRRGIKERGIFIPRAIERVGAGWISNRAADPDVSFSCGKENMGVSNTILSKDQGFERKWTNWFLRIVVDCSGGVWRRFLVVMVFRTVVLSLFRWIRCESVFLKIWRPFFFFCSKIAFLRFFIWILNYFF